MIADRRAVDSGRQRVRATDHSRAFKDFEAAGWSRNAAGYDRLTGRITARVADALLAAAAVRAGSRVLDVGCGPGHLCAAAAARGARPVGVDLAEGMVAAARAAHPRVEFACADAEALPFSEGSFDAVLGAFVVNHVPHPERAAAEMRRVVHPGGRVALAMWARPERVAFLGLLDAAMRAAGVRPEAAVPPGPPAYRFADDDELRALLGAAGLEHVQVREVAFGHVVADAAELWDGIQTGSVRTAAQLGALRADERARVRRALEQLLEARRSAGGLELETAVKIASAVSPAA